MAIKVNRTYKVTTKDQPLRERSGPGTSYAIKGSREPGYTFECTELSDDGKWAKNNSTGNWLCIDAGVGYKYLEIVETREGDPEKSASESNNNQVPIQANENDIVPEQYILTYSQHDEELAGKIPVKTIKGILGMPYQFMSQTDTRLLTEDKNPIQFGRKYADRIMTNLPLLFITPGKPSFLQGFSSNSKKNVLSKLVDKFFDNIEGSLEDILNLEVGRYYTFNMAYAEYYEYLNPMCQIAARYLGLNEEKYNIFGENVDKYNWENYTDPVFKTYVSAKESIGFYIDSPTQISESFGNSTTQSMLEGLADQGSQLGKELGFLLGTTAGKEFSALSEEDFKTTKEALNKITEGWFNGAELVKRLTSGLHSVAMGGRILFPEIWDNSDFSRTYSIDIKLRTPAGDKLSWYLNILVPTLHLIALTLPKQLDANSYNSPFLVRAFYKGMFNIDMGIITSMTISKGAQNSWTVDGLPTEIDISLDIKDLYSSLSLTKRSNLNDMIKNISLMDYLANSCGININKPELARSFDIYMNQVTQKFTDWPSRMLTSFQNGLSNAGLNLFNVGF